MHVHARAYVQYKLGSLTLRSFMLSPPEEGLTPKLSQYATRIQVLLGPRLTTQHVYMIMIVWQRM